MRFPREAVEDIELPPPAEATGRTFIGPAPAPRPSRRKPVGTTAPQQAVVEVKTNPFAPVSTEVIAPELVAAAIAAEAKAAAAALASAAAAAAAAAPVAPETPAVDEGSPDGFLPNEPFHLEPIALDGGTIDLAAPEPIPAQLVPEPAPVAPMMEEAPVAPFAPVMAEGPVAPFAPAMAEAPVAPFAPEVAAATLTFLPEAATLPFGAEAGAAPQSPIADQPRVEFHPERLVDIGQTDPDLPPPPAELAPEQIAAAIAPEPVRARTLQPGTLVDDYELVEAVASDATGVLYTAHDSVEQPVAIKVIAHGACRDEASVEKLLHSARSSRQLDSVHLVEVQGAGRLLDGRVYLVMEPLRGETLGARMARGRLPIDEAMDILSQLAAAVADLHKAGVVRCDIGPDSVMVRKSEEGFEVKLLQVGLARLSRGSSPERNRGETVGPPADIHALGLLAQHMLVGTPVDQSVVVSEARPEVPAAVDRLVDAMLASDPRRRPSALDVHAGARKLAHALYRGSSIDLPFRLQARLWLQKPSNRILLAVQVCLAVAGLLSYLFLRDGDSSDADAASHESAAPAPAADPAGATAPAPAAVPEEAAPAPAAPKKKDAAPKASVAAPKAPVAAPRASVAAPKAPVAAPKAPVAAPKAAAPKAPVAAPKTPVAAPKAPAAQPKAPAAAPSRDRDAPIKDPFGEM